MTIKKVMSIIAVVIAGGIGLFVFVLYATIKTKSTSLDQYEPFKEWVGKTVTLYGETVLFEEKVKMNSDPTYPYMLLDSLHPQWQYAEERQHMPEPDLEKITVFPAGTKLKIEKAIQYTNGVSGSSYPTVRGTIIQDGREYRMGYQWGHRDIGKAYDGIEKCWSFNQAPWQTRQDTAYYALPEAKLW